MMMCGWVGGCCVGDVTQISKIDEASIVVQWEDFLHALQEVRRRGMG